MLDPATVAQLTAGATATTAALDTVVRLILIQSESSAAFKAGVGLFVLPETAAAKPGFAVLPFGTASAHQGVDLSDLLHLAVEGTLQLDGGIGALVRPGKNIELLTGFGPGTPSVASGTVSIALRAGNEGEPTILLGTAGASHFEIVGASALGGARFNSGGTYEIFVELGMQAAKMVIKPGPDESDSFLSALLPRDGLSIGTDLTVGFSTAQGLYFGGSGCLEINLPTHISLGPVEIQGARIAVGFRAGAIPIELGATIKGELLVLTTVVENIGLTATLTFPKNQKGNLGPVDLALGFRPPNGVGLAIDVGVVKGGGYLFLDFEKGEYAGALELTFSGFLSLKAIGLINTKMPDGSDGFSLLIIITAEFVPGLQLGFGFSITGVGGLLGLNRAVMLDPLAQGVRTGAVNNILFPTNVIANAPRIISDLRAIFPVHVGKFLIGPMAKVGWGTPTLVSVSLGIIIEIPGNVVILGRLRVNLPTEEAPVLLLQLTFIGVLEFDKKRLWFFASLFESRILFITIDGEMGLLMDFGAQPNFVLSVGGFHPQYKPPALPFPTPNRISLNIINESYARIRADAYFAVTSNSVQFGTHSEMFFGFDALSVEGYFEFDALIRFSPLSFQVDMATGFSVKVFGLGIWGVHLRGSLSGPQPWHIRGSASIELLFFDISVDVDVTFGDHGGVVLPPIAVLPKLSLEFQKLESWTAALPPSANLLTTLRKLDEPATLVLHPLGVLRLSQRFAPLNIEVSRIGTQAVSDVHKIAVEVSGGPLTVKSTSREMFARGQYQHLSDADQLSKPAFEPMDCGVELAAGAAEWATGVGADRYVRYEQVVVDTAFERYTRKFFELSAILFAHLRAGAAIARSPLSQRVQKRREPFLDRIAVPGDQYAVAFKRDNRSVSEQAVFGSRTEAEEFLNMKAATDSKFRKDVHVIPAAELNRAA